MEQLLQGVHLQVNWPVGNKQIFNHKITLVSTALKQHMYKLYLYRPMKHGQLIKENMYLSDITR